MKMLSLLASAALFAGASAQCTAGSAMAIDENNYVVDTFTDTLLFTYAINQCTGISLFDSDTFYKYTCSKDSDGMWWVTKRSYSDSACSADEETIKTWSEEDATEAGEKEYFKCDGKNNYATINIGVDPTCETTTTVVGGLGGCGSNTVPPLDMQFYCDSTTTLVQLYSQPGVNDTDIDICDDSLFCTKWSITKTCAVVTILSGQTVYGTFSKCALTESTNSGGSSGGDNSGEDSGDGDDTESSASSQVTLFGIVVSLIVGLFH